MKPEVTVVFNVGSSSLKATVFRGERQLNAWNWDLATGRLQGTRIAKGVAVSTFSAAVDHIADDLGPAYLPSRIAHRVVHGGPNLSQPTKINPQVVRQLVAATALAPLHMPPIIRTIRATQRHWPTVPQWAVFDTGLYQHLPDVTREYALPNALREKYHIRHYGYHGTAHLWAATQVAKEAGRSFSRWNGVTVHLGSGSSLTAWRVGRPIETSMGFSTISGPLMSTRTGDLDPMIPLFLMQRAHLSATAVTTILTKKSGFLAMTGSADVRDILASLGHAPRSWQARKKISPPLARAALHMFTYEIAKILGGYLALLPKDAEIIFTGTMAKSSYIRRAILAWLPEARKQACRTIPANESLAIVELLDGVLRYPK